jgi:predicted permease
MNWLTRLFSRRRLYSDLSTEVRSHLDEKADALVASGISREEATRIARREFGNMTLLEERSREVWQWPALESFLADIRFALRMLRKSPGFTAIAILTLALGIGANSAIFSMINGILLRDLPYPQPSQLYSIHEFIPQWSAYGPSLPVNGGNFLSWEKGSHAFDGMTLIDEEGAGLLGMGQPQWLNGAAVTSDFFSLLGVQPTMGHAFEQSDGSTGSKPEVILTNELWREQFHSDPNILGKIINLGDRGLTVVGVLPASFNFPRILAHTPQYLVPFGWEQYNVRPGIGTHNYFAIGRLKNSATPQQAEAQLNIIEAGIAKSDPDSAGKLNLYAILTPLKTEIVGSTREALWMLTLAAGLVLLIVCANLANLLLAKNSKRVREVALRSAFGAGRWRLARQFLTETSVLAAAGGCLGLLVAKICLGLLVRNAPVGIPRVDQVRLDSTVLWFTLAITILAALIFGLLPSLRATRIQLFEQLKSSGPTVSASRQGARLRAGLVIGEIALCAALLPACLLLAQSLRHVVMANHWLDEDHVVTADLLVNISFKQAAPTNELTAFNKRNSILNSIEAKVQQLPGVESAGFTSTVPLEGEGWGDAINFQETPLPEAEQPAGEFRFVTPGYFPAIGLPLVKGRFFIDSDAGQPVAVISESVAQKMLGARDPLGMHVDCHDFSLKQNQNWCRVVGVVNDVRAESDQSPLLVAYFPLWLFSENTETLVVRTKMDAASAAGAIREAVWSVDPDLAIPQEKTLSTILASNEAPRRYETSLVVLFALCAIVLAMLGLYGVISYSVSQRNHEIGVRMALGAQRRDVLRMVIREAMILTAIGIAVGIGGAVALARFLRTLLFEIRPTDPLTFLGVVILLCAVALLACYIPARRAMKVDPMVALRYE